MTTTVGPRGPQGRKGCPAELACLQTNSEGTTPNTGFSIPVGTSSTFVTSLAVPFDMCGRDLRMLCVDRDGNTRVTKEGNYNIYFSGTVMVQYSDEPIDDVDFETTPPNTIIIGLYINGELADRKSETNMVTVPNTIAPGLDGSLIFYQPVNLVENIRLNVGDRVQVRMVMVNGFENIVGATLLSSETDKTLDGEFTQEGSYLSMNKTMTRTCRTGGSGSQELILPGCPGA